LANASKFLESDDFGGTQPFLRFIDSLPPATAPAPPSPSATPDPPGVSALVIGAAVGGSVAVLAAVAVAWFCARRRGHPVSNGHSGSSVIQFVEHRDDETLVTYADSTTVTCEAVHGPSPVDASAFRHRSMDSIFMPLV
jgi:hypothetical protein